MKINYKRKAYVIIAFVGVIIFPFVLLLITNRLQYVDLGYAVPLIFTQIFAVSMLNNALIFSGLIVGTLALVIFSMTFLFEIKIEERTKKLIQDKWYWKILKQFVIEEKHGWHIFLGYFVAILAINSLITPIFLDVQRELQTITDYQGYISTAFMGSIVIFLARILSKFPLQIAGTNIGTFIILVYISGLIYGVISFTYIPVEQLVNFVTYRVSDAEGIFMIYGVTVLVTCIFSAIDYGVITKLWKKPL